MDNFGNAGFVENVDRNRHAFPHPQDGARRRAVGFVITNGYRGDYATWEVALRRNLMIGTVQDIEEIAADPVKAIDLLKSRAGFKQKPSRVRLDQPTRFRLGGWNIELTM